MHHVDPAPGGHAVDLLDEILGPIIDRRGRAQFERPRAFRIAAAGDDDVEPEQVRQRDRHRPDAAGPAMDQHPVAVGREPALEQIDPHREQGLGHRRGLGHPEHFGDPEAGAHRRDAIVRITAARDQGADLLAQQCVRAASRRDHFTRDFEPEHIARAWRRRIEPAALQDVGPVDPRRGDLDQHLARTRFRQWPLDQREPARPVGHDRASWSWEGCRSRPAY